MDEEVGGIVRHDVVVIGPVKISVRVTCVFKMRLTVRKIGWRCRARCARMY